ncbi:MAG: acyl-CoA thioesterase [Salinirussus sp.]
MTNNYDTAHGGVVMHFMDEIGAMSAMLLAGESCVTASVERIDFLRPIPRGDTAVIESWVYDTGRTSVDVRLRVDRQNPRTAERERTSTSCFTYVAVGDDGSPVPVPDLAVETERGERLRAEARDAD